MAYTQLMGTYLQCGNASDTVDYVMLFACTIMALTKIVAIRVHMSRVRTIFVSALDDWLSVDNDKSRDIMLPFAKTGRSVFFLQMVSCYVSNTLIIIGALPFLMPPMDNGTSWLKRIRFV